jgi:hypothetical protein
VEDRQTCGQGLVENAVLPAHLGAVSAAMAEVLEVHMNALDPDDGNTRFERNAYAQLVDEHREAAARLLAVADHMARCRDLPMGWHDPEAMASGEPYQAFAGLVTMKHHLLDLLREQDGRDQSMLVQMGAGRG